MTVERFTVPEDDNQIAERMSNDELLHNLWFVMRDATALDQTIIRLADQLQKVVERRDILLEQANWYETERIRRGIV